jgi:putative spermidine/putrescine transport system substrate-binding protein
MLEGSVPAQLIQAFNRQQGEAQTVSVIPADSLVSLYEMLQGWQGQSQEAEATPAPQRPVAHWLTLGDYWLAPAIRQDLIQPIEAKALDHWEELPDAWSKLLRRNTTGALSASGGIWGVPYRWSNLAILYDPAQLSTSDQSIMQWNDLLRPELQQRIILPNHPRLVIGLGLKAIGASANVENPKDVPGLTSFLQALHQQVRVYDSDYYLESLIVGDASAVVGWAAEIQSVLQQYRQFQAVLPGPGTLVSADLWVQPKAVPAMAGANRWPDFCLTADFATQFASYSQGVSPRWLGLGPEQLPEALRQHPLLSPPAETQANSEFLLPLSETAYTHYLDLWTSLRN